MKRFRSEAHYHTPPASFRHIFHSVLRAGHHRVGTDFTPENLPYPGHDLILTVDGIAPVQIEGRLFSNTPGDLVWVNCHHLDSRWPARTGSWEMFWMHIDSEQADAIAEVLNVAENPIFKLRRPAEAVAAYKLIFRLLRSRPAGIEAALHAAVASLIATLFNARQLEASEDAHEPQDARTISEVSKVINTMRSEYFKPWKVKDLAQLMNLSEPQFFRRFSRATGSSPMDWLRRERINQAKRRLAETRERIDHIATGVGYADPHFFSRDFRRMVGVSPRQYRRQEHVIHGDEVE